MNKQLVQSKAQQQTFLKGTSTHGVLAASRDGGGGFATCGHRTFVLHMVLSEWAKANGRFDSLEIV